MIGVVPLAGPDFVRADGSVKALIAIDGQPLLRRALESRSWWRSGDLRDGDLVFVLHDDDPSRAFARDHLAAWYPASRTVFVSAYTGGAALSALAGVALLAHRDQPVCVDLADILYTEDSGPARLFASTPGAGGLGLCFLAADPCYSYFALSPQGLVLRAREKQVISAHASAGTYFFRSPAVYLRAAAHSLDHRAVVSCRDLFFVCPTFDGVIDQGLDVHVAPVADVFDLKVAT